MPFEYDLAKSATNKAKHGIDFDDAQALWKDARMLEAPAKPMTSRAFWGRKDWRKPLGRHLRSSWRQCADHLSAARPETGDRSL